MLTIPVALFSSQCTSRTPTSFLISVEKSCDRMIDNLQTQCLAELNVQNYISNLYIGSTPRAQLQAQFVQLTTNKVQKMTLLSNGTTIYTTLSSLPTTSFTTQCLNALTKVTYVIRYQDGVIISASADVIVKDVSVTSTSVSQMFATIYLNSTTSISNIRAKSGNPGYLLEKPILFGSLTTTADGIQTIEPEIAGISMLKGSCDNPILSPITFNQDSVTGLCVVFVGWSNAKFFISTFKQHKHARLIFL